MCLVSRNFGEVNALCKYPLRFSFWTCVRKKLIEAKNSKINSITNAKKRRKKQCERDATFSRKLKDKYT